MNASDEPWYFAGFGAMVLRANQLGAAKGMTQEEIASRLGVRWEPIGSLVYFVQPGTVPMVKIGYAKNLMGRLCALRMDNHLPVRLLVSIQGGQETETALHKRFAHLREHGEWFRLEKQLAAAIAYIRVHASEEMLADWEETSVGRRENRRRVKLPRRSA